MPRNFLKDAPLPSYDQLVNCMHCGLCLPTCPTYELTKLEIDSPRGRIQLMRAVADETLEMTDSFRETIDFCLDCQACVTACPAGVEYGQLVEATKLQIAAEERAKRGRRSMTEKILNWLFLDLRNLQWLGRLIRVYQKMGVERFLQVTRLIKPISGKLHDLLFMAPAIPARREYRLGNTPSSVKRSGIRVGILKGCVQDIFFRDINQDTIDVLNINGYEVYVPEVDLCCGSVHGHNGDLQTAKQLARQLIDTFEKANVDWIILNSAGCGAYMKEYGELLSDDEHYSIRAKQFSARVKDITEFLIEHDWIKPVGLQNVRVTYHEPCHLVHTQKISEQPRQLIKSIPGLEYCELLESSWCCGSAGIYNIVRYEDSLKILERKMENIRKTQVSTVVTGNPGCMIQLMFGVRKFKVNVQILHPISLLRMAYQTNQG